VHLEFPKIMRAKPPFLGAARPTNGQLLIDFFHTYRPLSGSRLTSRRINPVSTGRAAIRRTTAKQLPHQMAFCRFLLQAAQKFSPFGILVATDALLGSSGRLIKPMLYRIENPKYDQV